MFSEFYGSAVFQLMEPKVTSALKVQHQVQVLEILERKDHID